MDVIDEGKSNRHVAVTSECLSPAETRFLRYIWSVFIFFYFLSKSTVDCLWCLSCTQSSLLSRDVTADAASCWLKLRNISGGCNIKAPVLVITRRFAVKETKWSDVSAR